MTLPKIKVFYDNKRGVRVTDSVFSTRTKDEDISAIVSVKVGRDPLYLAGISGAALGLFAFQFGDLLFPDEQIVLAAVGITLLVAGFSVASLTIGSQIKEKTVWWYDYWTVQRVRRAIRDAKHVNALEGRTVKTLTDKRHNRPARGPSNTSGTT